MHGGALMVLLRLIFGLLAGFLAFAVLGGLARLLSSGSVRRQRRHSGSRSKRAVEKGFEFRDDDILDVPCSNVKEEADE